MNYYAERKGWIATAKILSPAFVGIIHSTCNGRHPPALPRDLTRYTTFVFTHEWMGSIEPILSSPSRED